MGLGGGWGEGCLCLCVFVCLCVSVCISVTQNNFKHYIFSFIIYICAKKGENNLGKGVYYRQKFAHWLTLFSLS